MSNDKLYNISNSYISHCGIMDGGVDEKEGCACFHISCQKHKLKHLNFQYIYLISYKIAKKANPIKWICPTQK